MGVVGSCYVANSLVSFMAPSLPSIVFLRRPLLGAGALTLWLIVRGVDAAG